MESGARRHRRTDPAHPIDATLPNLAAWIGDGGEVSIGRYDRIACVAMALIEDNMTAGIRRRPGETLGQLLERLDATRMQALDSDEGYIDEINNP